MDRSKGFECDRQAKNDFTASTANYYRQRGCSINDLIFHEMTSGGTFVPFGSPLAFSKSRMDVYMVFKGLVMYVFEIKERQIPSTSSYIVDEGAFLNPEKLEEVKRLISEGYRPIWIELYTDGLIRSWNLFKIDLNTLQKVRKPISRYTVYNGKKIMQDRYLLPVSAATEYTRIHDDEQGDS